MTASRIEDTAGSSAHPRMLLQAMHAAGLVHRCAIEPPLPVQILCASRAVSHVNSSVPRAETSSRRISSLQKACAASSSLTWAPVLICALAPTIFQTSPFLTRNTALLNR